MKTAPHLSNQVQGQRQEIGDHVSHTVYKLRTDTPDEWTHDNVLAVVDYYPAKVDGILVPHAIVIVDCYGSPLKTSLPVSELIVEAVPA